MVNAELAPGSVPAAGQWRHQLKARVVSTDTSHQLLEQINSNVSNGQEKRMTQTETAY